MKALSKNYFNYFRWRVHNVNKAMTECFQTTNKTHKINISRVWGPISSFSIM